jgi:hypothetical protein
MIGDIDKDGSGSIDFEEFLDMMTAKMVGECANSRIWSIFCCFSSLFFSYLYLFCHFLMLLIVYISWCICISKNVISDSPTRILVRTLGKSLTCSTTTRPATFHSETSNVLRRFVSQSRPNRLVQEPPTKKLVNELRVISMGAFPSDLSLLLIFSYVDLLLTCLRRPRSWAKPCLMPSSWR